MKQHQSPEGKSDDWITPEWILAPLGAFDLDPCPYPWNGVDGLELEWEGRVWLNPPFNRYERPKWMRKMQQHGNGIMLIPAATETKAFYDHVWRHADAVCFIKGRPHFNRKDGRPAKYNCGTAICLVAYGKFNAVVLRKANLGWTI